MFDLRTDLGRDLVQPYALENQKTDRQLELRHADLTRCWNMDRVSNAPFPKVCFNWRLILIDGFRSHFALSGL